MRSIIGLVLRILFFSIVLAVAVAQEPIKVTTRLVETTVIVRDAHGPIADLTADSFKLFDSGKQQKIAVFRVSKPEPAAPPTSIPPLLPGVFSNRHAKALARPLRHTMLLIDTLNTPPPDQVFAQRQLLSLLKTIDIRDPAAIFVLGEKSHFLQDFTTDRELLTKAAEAFRPEQSQKLIVANAPTPRMRGSRDAAAMASKSAAEMRGSANQDRSWETIDAFEQLGEYLARVPGKKSVIWISNGFPIRALREQPDRMRMLDRADIAIYPVYARGLIGSRSTAEIDSLKWVADETGGRAFYGRNDIGASIQEAMEDSAVTYTLGFYSQHDQADGNFHALKVAVDRPGVEVRHRAGYFDVEAKGDSGPSGVAEDASDIGLTAEIVRIGTNLQVTVQIDCKDFRLQQVDGRWKGSAELGFVSQSARGVTLESASKTLTFDMTDKAYQARRIEGLTLQQLIPVHDGAAKIRVAIVDRSGAAGSVSIALPKP
jgi:VWFA-related protein